MKLIVQIVLTYLVKDGKILTNNDNKIKKICIFQLLNFDLILKISV